nr:MAG TPA: hypothetical protein [Caudoviricetes sp.]DAQ50087.1 MAG TPA: hypothetical protein [Caudoviricetes sp.]DAS61921.1 MAG TPA: hypothetical protein [Caudoviricetes sp.]
MRAWRGRPYWRRSIGPQRGSHAPSARRARRLG